MDEILFVASLRMIAYGMTAFYLLNSRRWFAWATFTALVFTTYIYAFSSLTPLQTEIVRTIVAGMLIYITVRRK